MYLDFHIPDPTANGPEAPLAETEIQSNKRRAERTKKIYDALNPEIARLCDSLKTALATHGEISRWIRCAFTTEELNGIDNDDFHVPSVDVRKITHPGAEDAFLIFISDGTDPGVGSRLIFTAVSVWLASGFRAYDVILHLSVQLDDRGDRMKVFLENKECRRLMHGDGRD